MNNLPAVLLTQTVNTIFNQPVGVPASNGFNGQISIPIPSSHVIMAKPLSYQFRVAEHVDGEDNIMKVGLQVAVFEHDNYGVPQLKQDWTNVERVKIKV